jgi:arginase
MDDVSVVGLPVYTLAKYSGMGRSAGALRKAGLLSSLGGEVRDEGDAETPALEMDSLQGRVRNLEYFERVTKIVLDKVRGIRGAERVVCVGGECSFTVGTLAGFGENFEGKPGMMWIDTHGDFNTPETSPSGYIGGMCLAMACGRGPRLGNEIERRRPLLEEQRLVHCGSRALDSSELEMMRASPMGLFTMRQVNLMGTAEVARRAAKRLADSADWVVCHLDVDVLDPSVVKAVNYPTSGGMTAEQAVAMIRALDETRKLKVLEVAAYNADLDHDGSSAKAVVGVLREAFTRVFRK